MNGSKTGREVAMVEELERIVVAMQRDAGRIKLALTAVEESRTEVESALEIFRSVLEDIRSSHVADSEAKPTAIGRE